MRQYGIRNFLREFFYRIHDARFEKKLGIQSSRFMAKEELQVSNEDAVEYSPIGYFAIASALKQIPSISDRSLLDFGCGMGRVLAYAASLGVRKVVGVELSPELHAKACDNLSEMRGRKTADCSALNVNALDYKIPADVDVIYFYNPFFGETLKKVLENIMFSHAKTPREMYIIFFNNEHFEKLIDENSIVKIYERVYSQYYNCAVYRIPA